MSIRTEPDLFQQSKEYRQQIDLALEGYTSFGEGCPPILSDAIRYMLLTAGKRIRPLLTLFSAEACGGVIVDAMPAACAVEMIHTYSLIHDDLPSMDDDDLRRGQPTCHRKFDEATAILAGDALQTLAFEIMARDVKHSAAKCIQVLATASGPEFLIGGQIDDLAGSKSNSTLEHLENIHRRKTAALLIVSLELGGLIAGANDSQLKCLKIYGEKLGLAFQIVDDLLDFCGDETKMGKQSGKDQLNGTLTFPALLGVDASRIRARNLIDEAIDVLHEFDQTADPLRQVAEFVISRDF